MDGENHGKPNPIEQMGWFGGGYPLFLGSTPIYQVIQNSIRDRFFPLIVDWRSPKKPTLELQNSQRSRVTWLHHPERVTKKQTCQDINML